MSTLIVLVHAAFVLFVAAGALLVWRWPRVAWLHLPAVAWAAWIELSGGVCPLTPLEQEWRRREGLAPYEPEKTIYATVSIHTLYHANTL